MANTHYPITGIPKGLGPAEGQVPLRYEIDAWSQNTHNTKQVHLFLLALHAFQQMDPKDKLSYFQITGIHGSPFVSWDDDMKDEKAKRDKYGYCTHNSTLFSTWHRPYILLYEQRLSEIMHEIAAKYPTNERATYQAAADNWRLPYWDWAQKKDRGAGRGAIYDVPLLVKAPTQTVVGPEGIQILDPNPLYRFVVPEGKTFGDFEVEGFVDHKNIKYPYNICQSTSRYNKQYDDKSEEEWKKGYVDNECITEALQAKFDIDVGEQHLRVTLGEWVHRTLHNGTFDSFTTTLITGGKYGNDVSLEGVHNAMHVNCGGANGHMAWPQVSAFDPLFWLHHANIDRLFAIWQTLHPDAWFSDPSQQLEDPGNFYIKPGSTPKPDTELHPFRDGNGVLYTSDSIRDWFPLHYSYPELQKWLPRYRVGGIFVKILYQADVALMINRLYSDARNYFRMNSRPGISLVDQDTEGARMKHDLDYICHIVYSRYENSGFPYRILVFFGKPDEDSKKWLAAENLVGALYTFGNPGGPDSTPGNTGCGNCDRQNASKLLSKGQIPLFTALAKSHELGSNYRPQLGDMNHDSINDYLQQNLHWTATQLNGDKIPLEDLPSFQVSILRGSATHYLGNESKMSKFENYHRIHHITQGRPGGYSLPEESS